MKMERIADAVFPVLINLIQNSAKVMSTSGLIACRYIIRVSLSVRVSSHLFFSMFALQN